MQNLIEYSKRTILTLIFIVGLWETTGAYRRRVQSQYKNGDVRLTHSRRPWEGNIAVYYAGVWGLVCDDGWDTRGGDVVCRQLGYKGAKSITKVAAFGKPAHGLIWLDDVRCIGDEPNITRCDHRDWGRHNCDRKEAAGVYCSPDTITPPPPPTTTPPPSTTPQPTIKSTTKAYTVTYTSVSEPMPEVLSSNDTLQENVTNNFNSTELEEISFLDSLLDAPDIQRDDPVPSSTVIPSTTISNRRHVDYHVRVAGGRPGEKRGRVEVTINGRSGVICGDGWSLLEATVVCQQLGWGYGFAAYQEHPYGGDDQDKLLFGVKCNGDEKAIEECYHAADRHEEEYCSDKMFVAGVACIDYLPDLLPNVTVLYSETRLEDRSLLYLQCAMEEDCAAKSAYIVKKKYPNNWYRLYRRLLRFSSATHNIGTADFKPHLRRQDWEWHECHRHYHSMQVFAHYDLLDNHGNKVAEGHKASFCLEDVECKPGYKKKYRCVGYSEQGISVGCADVYRYSIDCQWIDITDVKRGNYIFRIHVNPENKVAELKYNNNVVTCNLRYTGFSVIVTNCHLS